MRKLITGALAASATLALAVPAVAQAPQGTFAVTAKPSKAGTPRKPKNVKLTTAISVNAPNTTVGVITLKLPKGLKFSGKGFKKCSFAALQGSGPSACPSGSKAGPKGSANALAGTAPLNFDVYPFVENASSFLFYLSSTGGGLAVQRVIRGKLSNRGTRMDITIPIELRQPVPGLDATLLGLKQAFYARVGRHYIVSSTGCKGRKWKLSGTLTFSPRADGAAVPAPLTTRASTTCS